MSIHQIHDAAGNLVSEEPLPTPEPTSEERIAAVEDAVDVLILTEIERMLGGGA